MLYQSLFAFALLAGVGSALPSQLLLKRQFTTNSAKRPVVDATYDGKCFYPKPTEELDLNSYLGRWYQVAGSPAPFTAGCKCIYAEYALNDNGTVNVSNGCELASEGRESTIQGTATPVSPYAGYGHFGVLRVQFPGQPEDECPGPNYIIQDVGEDPHDTCNDDTTANADDSFAIVQTANFTTLFLLSRQQAPGRATINAWLERAGQLGSDLSNILITDQSNCQFTD